MQNHNCTFHDFPSPSTILLCKEKIFKKLLVEANNYCNGSNMVRPCYADVNCRLLVKWADENEEDTFFSCMDDLAQMKIS